MPLNVISNFAANVAHRNLAASDMKATESLAKLSAGTRVLTAKDDAASLAIGSRLSAEVSAMRQATVNAGQAISLLQVADGSMSQHQDILVRLKTLAVQSGSGQLGTTERAMLNTEYQELLLEIDRIANDTEFNGTKLLDNSFVGVDFKIGTGSVALEDVITVTLSGVRVADLALNATNISDVANSDAASTAVTAAIDTLNTARASVGATQNRLQFASASIAVSVENAEAARSRLMDLDIAGEMTNFTSKQILVQAGVAMLAQANQLPQNLLRLFQ